MHIRHDGDTVVLSNFGRLMDDPRHFDAARDVEALLAEGARHFVIELRSVGELGSSGLGLLMTITRAVRKSGGEVVLARLSRSMGRIVEEMRLDDYWEIYDSVDEATRSFARPDEDR